MEIPPGLIIMLPLLALWVWCLVDVVQSGEAAVRTFSRQQWLFMVIMLNVVGGLLWLAFGRPRR